MKTLQLTEMDRALIKMCANAERGKSEDLFVFADVSEKLDLAGVPSMFAECDKKESETYELENAEFKVVDALFGMMDEKKAWPFMFATEVRHLSERLEVARKQKDEKKSKKKSDSGDDSSEG